VPTIALKIAISERFHEFLIAELADLDFESFQEEEHHLIAYIPSARWNDAAREQIQLWLNAHEVAASLEEKIIPDQNWNRQWEETIGPVLVDPFLIKPTWREVPFEHRDRILLEIDPKMSFGTGYHETTRLMLRLMPDLVKRGDRVLDAGAGTGVLAIAAVKLGAHSATAFDIDPWSQENAVENFYLNQVQDRARMIHGGIEWVPSGDFDVILANINLNVILGLLPEFSERLCHEGKLLASGVLTGDRDHVVSSAALNGLNLSRELVENEWWAGVFARRMVVPA
jgi:ribosomal protein L11 methyltransferase